MNLGVDLTNVVNVQAWLQTTADATLLNALISSASQSVLNHIGRPWLGVTSFTELYDMPPKNELILRQWPVINVGNVQYANGVFISTALQPAGFPVNQGWVLETWAYGRPQKMRFYGVYVWPGTDQLQITYTAGYEVSDALVVPTTPFQLSPTRTWIGDVGVAYANGTALTKVAANPAQGQYAVTNPTNTATAIYTFASADAGQAVTLTYSSPPPPIEQAVWEIVGEAYKRRDRIGEDSTILPQGGTVTYNTHLALNAAAVELLAPYVRVSAF